MDLTFSDVLENSTYMNSHFETMQARLAHANIFLNEVMT